MCVCVCVCECVCVSKCVRVGREAHEENVRLGVRKRAESIIVFLPCRVPETKVDGLPVNHHIRRVVVELCVCVCMNELVSERDL